MNKSSGRRNRLTVCSTNVNSRWPTLLISRQISYKPWLFLLVPFHQDGHRLSPSECEFRSDFGRLVRLDRQIVFKKSSSQTDKQRDKFRWQWKFVRHIFTSADFCQSEMICPSRWFDRLLVWKRPRFPTFRASLLPNEFRAASQSGILDI